MTTAHPSYPNPTIVEALCEVHWQFQPGREWKSSLPGELFKHIQDEYPEMEPVPDGPRQRTCFRHGRRQQVLQFGENALTLNVFRPYPGWAAMRAEVLHAWERTRPLLMPAAITRIGVRYVNRIDRRTPHDGPGDWLVPGDYIPPGVLRALPGSFLRSEAHLDPHNRIILTVGTTRVERDEDLGAIIFDIDRFAEGRGAEGALGGAPFEAALDRLHEHVWETFCAVKSERLERLLRSRPSA